MFMDFLPELDYTKSFFNLIDYKESEDFYFYIITFINEVKIYILYYKVNKVEKNYLISNITFSPFYFDYPEIAIYNQDLGCKIMNSQSKGKVLTCCFQTKNGFFIVIQSFIKLQVLIQILLLQLFQKMGKILLLFIVIQHSMAIILFLILILILLLKMNL